MWFEDLMGFEEVSPENVRANIYIEGTKMFSKVNNASYEFGTLEVTKLLDLRIQSEGLIGFSGTLKVSEVIGDVQKMHCLQENENALFQAASQFNLLEMVGPGVTPEQGVGGYQYDRTQGPACAIACGAGTIYRNYFVPVHGKTGQSVNNQIDCLDALGKGLGNEKGELWKMTNGYALSSQEGLLLLNKHLSKIPNEEREQLKGLLKIGIQWNTEVTLSISKQLVSQAYCSALPVAYSHLDFYYWEYFARLVLEATYEATLYAGLINYEQTGCKKVFLTLVGGGAFGNETHWIIESIERSLLKFKSTPLDVRIVSYGSSTKAVKDLVARF